jgi:hypothetical protein
LKTFALIAAVLIAGYIGWGLVYPMGTWRYRLTIEVDTPESVKSGSSVIEVRAARQPKLTPETTTDIGISGEAVVVDLGQRGLLFSLLTSKTDVDYGYRIVFDMFPYAYEYVFKDGHKEIIPGAGQTTPGGIKYYASLRAKAELAPSQLPMLVRFRDTNDPKTVELVDPNDLAKSFGAGVRFKSATIEMVDAGVWPFSMFGITGEPVTRGIEKRLAWLEQSNPIFINWQNYPSDHPLRRLNKSVFVTGKQF